MMTRNCGNCVNGVEENGVTVCREKLGENLCLNHLFSRIPGDLCRICGEEGAHDNMMDGCCLNCYQRLQDDKLEREAYMNYLGEWREE